MVGSQMIESVQIRHEDLLVESSVCMMIFRLLCLGREIDEYIAIVKFWSVAYRCVWIVGAQVYMRL